MKDFNYYAPTQVVFGRESEEQVAPLVNATPHSDQRSEKQYGGTKVLVHYGAQEQSRRKSYLRRAEGATR